jgi:putative Mg2+ transporter-C (MgtC) family protein
MLWEDFLRLAAALVAGGIFGLERELHDKPAGFRTNMLICVGAALFTLLSIRMAEGTTDDVTRIAAGIVTGVGFLGAGAILHYRGTVYGLTTAATIWIDASIGMAFGAGQFAIGVLATLLAAVVLFLLSAVEGSIARAMHVVDYEVELSPGADANEVVRPLLEAAGLRCRRWTLHRGEDGLRVEMEISGRPQSIERLDRELLAQGVVRSIARR